MKNKTQIKYSFFRLFIEKLKQDENKNFFSLLGINFSGYKILNHQIFYDPLIYLITKSLIDNLISLKIDFDVNLIFQTELAFKKNQYDLFEIFQETLTIIINNSLYINNINIYIMAESPRFKVKNLNLKRLMKNNLKKIFQKHSKENINLFLKKIAIHAGTGEKIGKTGNSKAIDFHLMTHLVKKDSKKSFMGYGFDRHALISSTHPDYKNYRNFNLLGLCQFNFKNALQVKSHSDGDLILHSICDAILMSLGEDDIGDFFLDSDENNLNRDSFDFVFFALNLALKKNLKLTKIYIKLFVSNVICDDLLKQDALFKIQNSLSYKLKINQNILSFEISTPFSINGSIARSEGIESQVFIFFEKEI